MSEQEVVFLRGKRVYLRPLELTDVPTTTRWINDPEVRHFLEAHLPTSSIEEEEWIKGLTKDKKNNLVLGIMTSDDVYIGNMGLHHFNWRDRIAMTGALIGEKSYWGRGYGTEAKMLLLDYAFNTLNLRKITSSVISFNKRSLHYSLRCGYKVDGRLRKHLFRAGRYWDVLTLSVFREEFERARKKWERRQAAG